MRKNRNRTVWNTRTVVLLGLMVALNIVLTRLLAVNIGGFVRLSLGNICSLLTGLWFGPFAGAFAGGLADTVGLMLSPSGAWIPLITLSSMVWGILPGALRFLVQGSRAKKTGMLCLITAVTSVVCQLGLTTIGLLGVYGPGIVPGRLIQFAGSTPVYCVVVTALYFSPVTGMVQEPSGQRKGVAVS